MTLLVVLVPARPRLRAGDAAPAAPPSSDLPYVFSSDGFSIIREGHAAPALLPKADQLIAVLPATDVSWHRITCPKAPQSRMAAALAGVLEEAVLEDATALHFALAPGAKGGDLAWVAAVDRAWLASEIKLLERTGLRIDRVVPAAWPDEPPYGHFAETQDGNGPGSIGLALTWAHADGVATWPLQGGLARALLPSPLPDDARFSATPAVAAPAERWLGGRVSVEVMSPAAHLLQTARSLWNLRQFDLAPKHRGLSSLREFWRRLRSPAWRPARFGLGALVALQLLGLNVAAWQQRKEVEAKRSAMNALLLSTYPQIRSVLDAPLQMQRETESLRAAAGRPGDADLEAALQAAASAWPPLQPVQALGFESGKLTVAATGWSEQQITAFRDALAPAGWRVEAIDERLTLSRDANLTANAAAGGRS